jgi:threonine/homoserine/homoserine lactone efflux protein
MASFLAFIGVSIIVIVTPGPDTAMTVRNTLLGGRGAGIATAFGVAVGQAIWALATSAGIVALLVASEPLFLAFKYAGAAYLIYLGFQALREALWPSADSDTALLPDRPRRKLDTAPAFRQGLVSDLGNPKMAVFFASLLPQFVSAPSFSGLLVLGIVFSAMTFLWLCFYAAAIAKAGEFLRRPTIRRWIEGVTGGVLIALGLRIAVER